MSQDAPMPARRILVVEDELLVSWVVQDMVADLGYTVVGPIARLGPALEAAHTQAIDAAVLDVNLGGEMSYPVAEALEARGVPFAFSTGYETERVPERYRVFPVLQKPLRRAELGAVLASMLAPDPRHSSTGTP